MQQRLVCQDAYIDIGIGGVNYSVYQNTRCWYVPVDSYKPEPGWYIQNDFPTGNRGGYSKSGPTNGTYQVSFPNLTGICGEYSDLNLESKYELNVLVGMFGENPSGKKILDKIKSGDIKIHFKSDNTIQVPAQYNAATNTIQIRFVNYMDIHQLSEELIHAVQHQQFYGNAMLTIFKDVEFEAKIFLDIARAINDEEFLPVVTMNQSNDFSGEYWKWIEKIGENKMFMSTDEKNFENYPSCGFHRLDILQLVIQITLLKY